MSFNYLNIMYLYICSTAETIQNHVHIWSDMQRGQSRLFCAMFEVLLTTDDACMMNHQLFRVWFSGVLRASFFFNQTTLDRQMCFIDIVEKNIRKLRSSFGVSNFQYMLQNFCYSLERIYMCVWKLTLPSQLLFSKMKLFVVCHGDWFAKQRNLLAQMRNDKRL